MTDETHNRPLEFVVSAAEQGQRLDAFLAAKISNYSRVLLQKAILADGVTVNSKREKPAYRLSEGQRVSVLLPEIPREGPEPENIPLQIIHEDDDLVVINKPAGMVVHPAKGHWAGTLASALQYHFNQLSSVGGPTRPGIVHRLDRDTSGVIVVAKNDLAHLNLAKQFEQRTTKKKYFAIVVGKVQLDRDIINIPLGKHPHQREKVAVRHDDPTAREAETYYEVQQRFDNFTSLSVRPKTGRTHQIRVHMAHLNHPILCDRLYGSRSEVTAGELNTSVIDTQVILTRQALHAQSIQITHPRSGQSIEFNAPLADDIQEVLQVLSASQI